MNSNLIFFKTYRGFESAEAISTDSGDIYLYRVGGIGLFARQKQDRSQKITLHNELHVSSFITNLVFISALRQKVYIGKQTHILYLPLKGTQFAQCKEIEKLFALDENNST